MTLCPSLNEKYLHSCHLGPFVFSKIKGGVEKSLERKKLIYCFLETKFPKNATYFLNRLLETIPKNTFKKTTMDSNMNLSFWLFIRFIASHMRFLRDGMNLDFFLTK
jgi:hypothetical protein